MSTGDPRKLLLFGGYGNLTGKQGDQDPDSRLFDGKFHYLEDLWLLDLATSQWTHLASIPEPTLPPEQWSTCFLRQSQTVVVMHARNSQSPFGTPADIFIFRLGTDNGFIHVPSRGDVPDGNYHGGLTALPGGRSALAFQHAGVFELTLD